MVRSCRGGRPPERQRRCDDSDRRARRCLFERPNQIRPVRNTGAQRLLQPANRDFRVRGAFKSCVNVAVEIVSGVHKLFPGYLVPVVEWLRIRQHRVHNRCAEKYGELFCDFQHRQIVTVVLRNPSTFFVAADSTCHEGDRRRTAFEEEKVAPTFQVSAGSLHLRTVPLALAHKSVMQRARVR